MVSNNYAVNHVKSLDKKLTNVRRGDIKFSVQRKKMSVHKFHLKAKSSAQVFFSDITKLLWHLETSDTETG